LADEDRFVQVMQVCADLLEELFCTLTPINQPFAGRVNASVDALTKMTSSVEAEINTLLTYFGENAESPEAPKPEDFFGLILSFSSSLQARSNLINYSHLLQKDLLESSLGGS
jgi:hypothetical protein